jgi:hypothetical protein
MRTNDATVDSVAHLEQLNLAHHLTAMTGVDCLYVNTDYSPDLARKWRGCSTKSVERVINLLEPAKADNPFGVIKRACAYLNDERVAVHLNTAYFVLRERSK